MENGISLKVIWFDEVEALLEVVFSCSNGYFSGQAEIYATSDDLSALADALIAFPSRPNDSRDFELGTFNPVAEDWVKCSQSRFVSRFRQPVSMISLSDYGALERSVVQVPFCGKPHRNRARYCA